MPPKKSPFEVRLNNIRPSDRDIVDDLRRVARRRRGRPMSFAYYWTHGRHAFHTVTRHFGTWMSAVAAAGLPHCIDRRVSTTDLLDNLARVWRKLGRQPHQKDMVKEGGVSRFSSAQYLRQFGSWNAALTAFAQRTKGVRMKRSAPSRRMVSQHRKRQRHINARLRSRVLIRDNCQCRLCGTSPLKDPEITLQVDHIVPWSKGGRTVLGNLQTLCTPCNRGKGDWQPSAAG